MPGLFQRVEKFSVPLVSTFSRISWKCLARYSSQLEGRLVKRTCSTTTTPKPGTIDVAANVTVLLDNMIVI